MCRGWLLTNKCRIAGADCLGPKTPQSHFNATSKPPQSLLIANRLGPQSHPKATPRLPQGYPKGLPQGYPKGLPQGHHNATSKPHQSYFKATSKRRESMRVRRFKRGRVTSNGPQRGRVPSEFDTVRHILVWGTVLAAPVEWPMGRGRRSLRGRGRAGLEPGRPGPRCR
jgi:hypothetical protein